MYSADLSTWLLTLVSSTYTRRFPRVIVFKDISMNASIWVVNLVFALLCSVGLWVLASWVQEHIKAASLGASVVGLGLLATAFGALPGYVLAMGMTTLAHWAYRESQAAWKSRFYQWL